MANLTDQRGRLTDYGFACGYVETRGPFRLWREHGVYHVNGRNAAGARVWESARTLGEGRRASSRVSLGGHDHDRSRNRARVCV